MVGYEQSGLQSCFSDYILTETVCLRKTRYKMLDAVMSFLDQK